MGVEKLQHRHKEDPGLQGKSWVYEIGWLDIGIEIIGRRMFDARKEYLCPSAGRTKTTRTVRREGVYVSASAGSIDLNAELAEPMEASYTPAWQSIMDGVIRSLISESERQVVALCKQLD